MSAYNYPGVYIKEQSSGPGPITGVSTSNLGLIGFTLKGPVDDPILVTSYPEFSAKFGSFTELGLTPTMAYAFFQNGGQRLYVVRVAASDAVDSYWDYEHELDTGDEEDLGNTVEASGIYNLQISHPPVTPASVQIEFESAGTNNIFTDAAGDGVLSATGGTGAGGTGFINYETGEITISLTNPADYAGGADHIEALYTYRVFRFQMKWPGLAGNYYRVTIEPGSSDYLDDATASWSRFTITVEEDIDAGVTGIASWSVVETFADVVLDDSTDPNYIATVMNAEFNGSDFIEVVDYGNEMDPSELAGTSVTAENFAATQIHSDGSSAVTPDHYNGKWKGWTYDLANGAFPTTFLASFTFVEGGPLMATVAVAAGTAVVVGPDVFDTSMLPLTMSPTAPSVNISCELTGVGHTNIIDTGVVGPGNLIESSTGVVVGTIDYTTGAISDPTGAIANTLDVTGGALADTFAAASEIHWVNGTQIGTGGGAATATVVSPGDTTTPAEITPSSVKISARVGDIATNTGVTISFTFAAGVVTLADTSNPFGNVAVGDIVVVQGATSAGNDGTFVVTNIAAAPASIDYANASGVTEAGVAGTTWNTIGRPFSIVDTGLAVAGNLIEAGTANAVGTIDYTTGQISNPAGAVLNVLDLTASTTTFAPGYPIHLEADYAVPVDVEDDGDGNLSIAATQATGYPQKFGLDANGTNTITESTGSFTLTWLIQGQPASGPAGVVSETADYYTDPSDSVQGQLAGGSNGSAVTSADVVGASLAADERGLWAFGKVDDLMQLVASDFQTDTTVADSLITYAELRKDKFVILTVPAGLTPQEAVNWKKYQLQKYTSYAALYYPHIKIIDPVNDVATDVPCGGHVAGVYARTDVNKNVGKAPAGTEDGALNWSVGLELDLTETQVGVCYPEKINCLVQWPHTGRCVWGARSLDIAGGEWPYIQMRRLFMFLEKSVFNATHSHVFKNNGPALWSAIRTQITSFLLGLFQAGYFAGTSADEAFFVICDRTNNPQNTVNQGLVFCDIGVAPNKPAEFIVFRFQQKALS